jgi:hypothetical protein
MTPAGHYRGAKVECRVLLKPRLLSAIIGVNICLPDITVFTLNPTDL